MGHEAEGPGAGDRIPRLDGWERRFLAAPPRLQEMAELYRSLGYEVRLEPPTGEDLADECAGCELALAVFRVVYTRMPR